MESKYDPDEFFNRIPNVIKFKCAVCGHLTPIHTQDLPPLLWRDDLITTTEFMTHSGGNGYELHFRTPDRTKYRYVEDACRKMIDHGKPQTNADRIRAMTDGELSEYLTTMQAHAYYHGMYHGKKSDEIEWLDWLQEEVNNGDSD